MRFVLLVLIIISVYLLAQTRMEDRYQEGYKEGMKSALKTNPPSEDLEVTCAGLWLGDQAKKYYEKENRRAR